jgi:uncharacterized protein YaiE (UPF0345 family)
MKRLLRPGVVGAAIAVTAAFGLAFAGSAQADPSILTNQPLVYTSLHEDTMTPAGGPGTIHSMVSVGYPNVPHKGQYLISDNLQYALAMQPDGNLVLYASSNEVLWQSGTVDHGSVTGARSFAFQSNGNLVLLNSVGDTLWATGTIGQSAGEQLVVQDDGNVVVYQNGHAVWQTHTAHGNSTGSIQHLQPMYSQDGHFALSVQADGNVVIYGATCYGQPSGADPLSDAVWQTGTYGHPGAVLVSQLDGNVVLYSSSGSVLWQTRTYGHSAPVYLLMQNDGNLVIYSDGHPIWQSHTAGADEHVPNNSSFFNASTFGGSGCP